MALFKVQINCVYLDLFPKTNIPKKIYKAGEFLELESIDVGDQPERLVEATEEEIAQYKAGKKTVPVPVVTSAPGNDDKPTESAQGNIDQASKEASKAKLLGDAANTSAPGNDDKPADSAQGKGSKK